MRVEFWWLPRTTRVRAISGAGMAIRAMAFDAAGGFDERFLLNYDENDFLRRLRGDVVYVPAARCRHLYNQSAGGSPEAPEAYARSEMEYLAKWGGAWARRFERSVAVPASGAGGRERPPLHDIFLTEASPLPSFETAAGCFGDESDVPADVWRVYRSETLYMRAMTRGGRILRTWSRARMSS
jgi:hypothetical protein